MVFFSTARMCYTDHVSITYHASGMGDQHRQTGEEVGRGSVDVVVAVVGWVNLGKMTGKY